MKKYTNKGIYEAKQLTADLLNEDGNGSFVGYPIKKSKSGIFAVVPKGNGTSVTVNEGDFLVKSPNGKIAVLSAPAFEDVFAELVEVEETTTSDEPKKGGKKDGKAKE